MSRHFDISFMSRLCTRKYPPPFLKTSTSFPSLFSFHTSLSPLLSSSSFPPFFTASCTLCPISPISSETWNVFLHLSTIQTTREVLEVFFFSNIFSCSCSMNGNDESIFMMIPALKDSKNFLKEGTPSGCRS